MYRIYKYKLNPVENNSNESFMRAEAELPMDAVILKYGCQGNDIFLWAEVDASSPTKKLTFAIFPTSGEVPNLQNYKYQDTVFMGDFVWHIYRIIY